MDERNVWGTMHRKYSNARTLEGPLPWDMISSTGPITVQILFAIYQLICNAVLPKNQSPPWEVLTGAQSCIISVFCMLTVLSFMMIRIVKRASKTIWGVSCSFAPGVMCSDGISVISGESPTLTIAMQKRHSFRLIGQPPCCFDRSSVGTNDLKSNCFCYSSQNQLGFPDSSIKLMTFSSKRDKSGTCMHTLSRIWSRICNIWHFFLFCRDVIPKLRKGSEEF